MKIRSVKFNFVMNMLLTASSLLFPLITFPYVSRVLLVEANGKLAFAASVMNYFTMIASLGLPTYGVRACAKVREDKEKLSKTLQELLIINGTVTAITFVFFLIAIVVFPELSEERTLFLIYAVGMVLTSMGATWFYSAMEQYAYITICSVAFKFLSVIMMFLWVKSPEDYIKYGAITMIAGSGSYVLNLVNLRKFVTFEKKWSYDFRQHLKPLFIFLASSAAISVYTSLDVVMLRLMKGNIAVGYYNAGIKVKTILTTVITSLGTVLLPRLSYYVQKEEKDAFYRTVGKAVSFVVVLGVPMVLYFMIFARESILFLAGEEFLKGAVAPMIILMPTVLLIGLSNITGIQILTPQSKEKQVLYSILWGSGIDFLLNLVLIPRYSASGAAFATLAAELAVLIVQCFYLKEILKNIIGQVELKKIIVSSIIACIVGMGVKLMVDLPVFFVLVISAVLFFGMYGGGLLVSKERIAGEIIGNMREVLRKK